MYRCATWFLSRYLFENFERKQILKIDSDLMANSKRLQFRVNNLNETLEKDLNIGIFQYDDYLAFYINLTAYEEYVNRKWAIIFE